MMESEKIIQTMLAIFKGADERNWTKIQNSMAQNVMMDYSSLSGKPAALLSSIEIIESWKGFLPGFDKTNHQLSNFQVNENGNSASVHFYGIADHFLDKEIWTVDGSYDAEVSKSKNLWEVTTLKFNVSSQRGNLNLPAMAMQRLTNKNSA